MKLSFLDEPDLEFGTGKHIDCRFGIINYGPLDVTDELAPRRIEVGIVATQADLDRTATWLERCRAPIAAKTSPHPNLAPAFPGFRPEAGFRSTLVLSDPLVRVLPASDFAELKRRGDSEALVREAVDRFVIALRDLNDHTPAKVLLCPVPAQVAELIDPASRPDGKVPPNFRDLLKARTLGLKPIQLLLPSTADPSQARKLKIRNETRSIQDDATRAWNLHAALYYKAHGRPWRLPRVSTAYQTCYVGISFFRSLDRSTVLVSMAQVFDERGEGVVVRGGKVEVSKNDRTPHLTEEAAATLVRDALRRYRDMHRHAPARVVVHKSSAFSGVELSGFRGGAKEEKVEMLDFVSLSDETNVRLFRKGSYPPLRGTMLDLDGRDFALYTRGSVDFFETYPGGYVPRPLLFRCDQVEESPRTLAREILALTKMDWNRTRFDGRTPLTIKAARSVGNVLRYVPEEQREIADSYAHYM
ncbi:MAG: hypothetical protein KJZ74_06305 [Gemmatimonadales bacterium]|nr:hypothetical protein [Gemmatimonadota bacterium]MCL4213509.1 hypothetical protein [Gemmatimonadales bacterium]